MNAMTNAMKEAGMKTPTVMYRIWNWLKDHPEKTAEDITKALGSNYTLATQLRDMYKRGMVTVFKDKSHKITGAGIHPMVLRYSVTNPREYELLPVPAVYKKAKPKVVKLPPYVNPYSLAAQKKEAEKRLFESVGVTSTRQSQPLDIDNMTVGEAKRIYAQLQEFFNK